MEWSAYFDLAQELVNLAEELDEHEAEAYRRSAVSRAYYAMFCTARDMLDGVGDYNPPPHGSEHAYVWNRFAGDPYRATTIRDLGQRLKEARVQADYENFIFNVPRLVDGAIQDAEDLKEALGALTL